MLKKNPMQNLKLKKQMSSNPKKLLRILKMPTIMPKIKNLKSKQIVRRQCMKNRKIREDRVGKDMMLSALASISAFRLQVSCYDPNTAMKVRQ